MRPIILFPSEPFSPRQIERDFSEEQAAASAAGFQTALVDHMAIGEGDIQAAVARVPKNAGPALMRGWMVTTMQYRAIEGALEQRGIALLTDANRYQLCHHFPASYELIEGYTPASAWTAGTMPTDEEILGCGAQLGTGPGIVKDYVKSQKHAWDEGCFIPELSDTGALL